MLNLSTNTNPGQIKKMVTRISAADAAGRTGIDAWHQYLQGFLTKTGTIAELEPLWLRSRIATLAGPTPAAGATNADLWHSYLNTKGYTGSINDKMNKWLDSGTA